jgi:hypothetical protein
MEHAIELISHSIYDRTSQSSVCRIGESLAARAFTRYELKLDGNSLPSNTRITREGAELHFAFPGGETFQITDWDLAHGSSLVLQSGALAYEDVAGRFVNIHWLDGASFSIRSYSGQFMGALGSPHTSNFQALASILKRLGCSSSKLSPQLRQPPESGCASLVPAFTCQESRPLEPSAFASPLKAKRCSCNFQSQIN